VPEAIGSKFYGCGNPIPLGIDNLHVLDLGSGSGRDCYVVSQLVGPNGSITGIDMTAEQVAVAQQHVDSFTSLLGYPKGNLKFVLGHIEFLEEAGIQANSMDLVISNCVVNLSPDKPRVIEQVWKVLKNGGEFYFSDVYCDRRLPEQVRKHEVLFGECIAGALYIEDFKRICRQVGFVDPREVSRVLITVEDPELKQIVGDAQFYSITYRLFKLTDLEDLCEDYGQTVRYKGTVAGYPESYVLDNHHVFGTNVSVPICGNTASILGDSWLSPHFEVQGDRRSHKGLFNCQNPTGEVLTSTSCSRTPKAASGCC
jgi:SAM-dependent methyltransferase